MEMKKLIFALLVGTIAITSCEEEEALFENISELEASSSLSGPSSGISTQSSTNPYILAALVQGTYCGNGGRHYTVYATSNITTSYDRTVIVYIEDGEMLIDQKSPIIPAGQTKSNNVTVFSNARRRYGNVNVVISAVSGNELNYQNNYEIRNTTHNVMNCYSNNPSGGGSGGSGDDEPCVGWDSDGDGICDRETNPVGPFDDPKIEPSPIDPNPGVDPGPSPGIDPGFQ